MKTFQIVDGSSDIYCTGDTMEQAIRNLDSYYIPSDFGVETWDQVVEEWMESEDGLGDLMLRTSGTDEQPKKDR